MPKLLHELAVAILLLQTVTGPSPEPMTMEAAAEIAAKNAFDVRTQRSVVEQSKQRLAESRAVSNLQLSTSGSYARYSRPQQAIGGFGGSISSASSAVISAQYPLDISGQNRNNIRFSQASYTASKQALITAVLDAKLRAREAFVAVLRAQASVSIAEQSVQDARAQLDQSEKLYREQAIALVDLARYRAQLTRFQSELVERQNELQIARHALNQQLALPIENPVVLSEAMELPARETNPEELIQRTLNHRPEILALRETAKAQGYSVLVAKAGLRPGLNLSLDYQPRVGNSFTGNAANSGTASLTLSIPLFDSGVTQARVANARQDQLQTRIALERLVLSISQEIRDVLVSQGSAESRLQNSQEQQKYAEEVYRISLIRQEAGQGTYVDVIDAATLLAQARTDVVNARYDYLLSALRLKRAVGDELATTTSVGGSK